MPELKIICGDKTSVRTFEGQMPLSKVLTDAGFGVVHPCGGRGVCKKCEVEVSGNVSQPTNAEISAGCRLSCQITLLGDAEVHIKDLGKIQQIELDGSDSFKASGSTCGNYGVAVDIGTTTVALKLISLKSGEVLSSSAAINPQTSVASDVMGRIGEAMNGKLFDMKEQIENTLLNLTQDACSSAGIDKNQIDRMVITGNTTMLYLLEGINPEALSHAPFEADCLFGYETKLEDIPVYLPYCMNAFVGADITCAVLASGMINSGKTSLLCDIGTNGEIALYKDSILYVTSTAAGPAFEGAGISCGCSSIKGAIDKVSTDGKNVIVHTIGDSPTVGLCGSGLLDAISVFLTLGEIDETGAVEEDFLPLSENVSLYPKDVRSVQLAKAAICAGIITLLESSETSFDEIDTFYIAGGFGSHLSVESAVNIGLIPSPLADKVKVIGNAALTGAAQILLNEEDAASGEKIAKISRHVNLGGNPKFNENFVEMIMFPEIQ